MRVEILGGPLDGKQMDVPDGTRKLEFPILTDLTQIVDGAPGQPVFDVVRCEINPLGFVMWPKASRETR